jgi:predicted nuclease with RNAse H fold
VAPACIGIDLAGLERNPTGVAVLRAGRLERLGSVSTDGGVLEAAAPAGRGGVVAINAPLTLPLGRCCLDDDCRCRHEPGVRSRQLERELRRMGVPILATALIKVLARRGLRLATGLREAGGEPPIEVYPYATLRLLGLPTTGKHTQAGRGCIHAALRPLVPGLDHPRATEHELDAVVCALTAQLWLAGRARVVGLAEEGTMVVPDAPWPTEVRRDRRALACDQPAATAS